MARRGGGATPTGNVCCCRFCKSKVFIDKAQIGVFHNESLIIHLLCSETDGSVYSAMTSDAVILAHVLTRAALVYNILPPHLTH